MNRLILFAHFDACQRIAPHVLLHLQGLRALGGRIHFISNSPVLPEELARLDGLVDDVLVRDNTGLDFGMWKASLDTLDLAGYDELVLTNSSVMGPFQPLEPLFRRMRAVACDFWGLTESWEGCWHIQSYFLVFRKSAMASDGFRRFWASVLPFRAKQNIIFSYELGLSAFLHEQGLVGAVAFPLEPAHNGLLWNLVFRGRLTRRIRRSWNPTLHYPDLLVKAGMPYGKLSLLCLLTGCTGIRLRWVGALFAEAMRRGR